MNPSQTAKAVHHPGWMHTGTRPEHPLSSSAIPNPTTDQSGERTGLKVATPRHLVGRRHRQGSVAPGRYGSRPRQRASDGAVGVSPVAAQPAASATEPIVPIPLFSVICSLGCRAGMDAPGGRRCPRDISSPWRDRCSTANRARCVGSGVGVALVASGVRKDLASQGANSGTVAGAAVLVERFSAD